MTNLYIDGRQAVLEAGTNIKITAENPLFTDAGTYTLEVNLPLDGCAENQRIFGAIHRADVLKGELVAKRWNFVLVAPPLHIEGKARISTVDHESVKVQLLAGRSALNDAATDPQGRDLYVDELKGLNDSNQYGWLFAKPVREKYQIPPSYPHARDMWLNGEITYKGRAGDENAVVLPIYSTTDKVIVNELTVLLWGGKGERLKEDRHGREYEFDRHGAIVTPRPDEGTYVDAEKRPHLQSNPVFAPQPFLIFVVERVLKALGFTVAPEDNAVRGTWQERLIIANCRPTLQIAQMLPHWTVKEFIREVQNFFGVVIYFEGRQAKIVRKRKAYGLENTTHFIEQPIDEYTATVEENTKGKDPVGANVAYKFAEVEKRMQLPGDIELKAKPVLVPGLEFINTLPRANYSKDHIFTNAKTGFRYAHFRIHATEQWQVEIVDPMGGRFPSWNYIIEKKPNPDVELRIVPVQTAVPERGIRDVVLWWNDKTRRYDNRVQGTTPAPIMATADTVPDYTQQWSVCDELYPKVQDTGKAEPKERDVIEVAYYKEGMLQHVVWGEFYSADFPTAVGNPFYVEQENIKEHPAATYRLLLNFNGLKPDETPAEDPDDCMLKTALSGYTPPDTNVQRVVSFIDRGDFHPEDIYIIKGRRYFCRKLEFNVTEQGMERLIKGYFHEAE